MFCLFISSSPHNNEDVVKHIKLMASGSKHRRLSLISWPILIMIMLIIFCTWPGLAQEYSLWVRALRAFQIDHGMLCCITKGQSGACLVFLCVVLAACISKDRTWLYFRDNMIAMTFWEPYNIELILFNMMSFGLLPFPNTGLSLDSLLACVWSQEHAWWLLVCMRTTTNPARSLLLPPAAENIATKQCFGFVW